MHWLLITNNFITIFVGVGVKDCYPVSLVSNLLQDQPNTPPPLNCLWLTSSCIQLWNQNSAAEAQHYAPESNEEEMCLNPASQTTARPIKQNCKWVEQEERDGGQSVEGWRSEHVVRSVMQWLGDAGLQNFASWRFSCLWCCWPPADHQRHRDFDSGGGKHQKNKQLLTSASQSLKNMWSC